MANSDKDILITPSVGGSLEPKIEFTGFDNNTVSLVVLDDGTLSVEGSAGQLFSISDSLAGTIFSVNDVSGIPSIEVDDDGTIRFAEFGGNVLIGTATDDGTNKVQIVGGVDITGTLTATTLSGSLNFSNLTNLPDPVLTLDGDVSGSATFTDLGNTTLTVTISDDSHNHIISNVDGLQTALDGKQATITGAATTITGSNLTVSRALISNGSGKVAVSDVTSTELGYLDGVTSAIQTQINGKQATITGAATTITSSNLTVSRALVSNGSGKVAVSDVTSTELGYLDGVTSAIQTQINGKQATITGAATTITGSNLTASRALISNASGKVAVSDVTSTELGYLDGVTSAIQTQLNGKQDSGSYAVTTNNLSDLSNSGIARNNLGLGALAVLSSVNAATITDNSVGAAELNVSGNGTTTQFLRSDGDGTFTWATPPDTTTNNFVNSVTFNGSGTLTLGRSGLGDLSDTLASGDITGPLGYTPYQEGTALSYSTATSNVSTNHTDYLVFPNGAGIRRMTDQGGLSIGCDSSLVLHAGDNRDKYFQFFSINSTVTAETAYLTADGEVKLVSNMQSGVAANAKTATLTAAGNFTVPGTVSSGGNNVLTTGTSFGGDVSGTYNAIVVDDNSHNHTIDNITNLTTTLSGKEDTITGAATTITSSNLTVSRALVSNGSGKVAVSAVTSTELGYLDGVTSAIQTQLDGKLSTTGKAADSEKLDNLDSTDFARYSASGVLNNALASGGWVVNYTDASNVDHIWFNDTTNTFYANADTTWQNTNASAVVAAASFTEGGTTLSSKYLGLTAKAADSQLLDGIDSTAFVRSNADDTITGDITLSNAALSYTGGTGDTSHIHVLRPQGGAYATRTSAITGAIKITLPVLWTDTMMRFHVDFYDYASGTVETGSSQGESWSMEVGGYNYGTSSTWINCFAYLKSADSTKFFPVRFGNDGTKACIYIGETTSTWSYPQILIRDFFGAFSGDTAANWADGWDVDFVTTGLNGVLVNSSLAARVPKGNFDVGTATSEAQIRITKPDDDVSDHLQFFSGTTRVGEIGAQDTTWLRINQVTNKNIYTPRYIRADGGLFVDDTSHGINGSGNLLDASLTGTYSNALTFSNASNSFTGTFSGDGSSLTSLTGANVTGTVPNADKVDNIEGASLLRSDTTDQFTGDRLYGDLDSMFDNFSFPQNPEGKHIKSPYFFNDEAYARLRGATVLIERDTGTGYTDYTSTVGTTNIDKMFNASGDFWNHATSGTTGIRITLTNLPKNLNYGSYIGVTFGNTNWRAKDITLRTSTDGGSNWTDRRSVTDQTEEMLTSSFSSGATATNALQWEFSNFNTTSMRIVSLYAYNYSSGGMEGLYLTRGGGPLYGEVQINSTALESQTIGGATFGNGWLQIGDATQGWALDDNELVAFGDNIINGSSGSTLTFSIIPAFNGGTSGSTAPFTVDSTVKVDNLNADFLDGLTSTSFLRSNAADTMGAVLTISTASTNLLNLYNTTNAGGAAINFSDNTNQGQTGQITFYHADSESPSSAYGATFKFNTDQPNLAVVLDETGDYFVGTNKVFHDGYHPNADKWTTTRTITLTGDVTGSASIDGSGDISIATTGGGGSTVGPTFTVTAGTAGDAKLFIIADTDNNDENDHPSLRLQQDGALVDYRIGIGATDSDTSAGSGNKLVITKIGSADSTTGLAWSPDGGTTVSDIVTGNVTGTLFADVISANQINADMIAANQITANLIAANAITANEIAANQVKANELEISSTASVANSIFFDGSNNRIDIKDASNVLRVRIGQL